METTLINRAAYNQKTRNGKLKIRKVPYPDFTGCEPCVGLDTSVFYPDFEPSYLDDVRYVSKFICSGCPMREPCLLYALHHEMYGIWGGVSEQERRNMRKDLGIVYVDSAYVDGYLAFQEEMSVPAARMGE